MPLDDITGHFERYNEFVKNQNLGDNVKKLHDGLVEHYSPHLMTQFDKDAIKSYGGESRFLNENLIYRHKYPDGVFLGDARKLHTRLNSVMDAHAKRNPLKHDLHVFSGTGEWNPVESIKENGIIHTPAWTSTSIRPGVAHNFAHEEDPHVLHFHLPAGYNKGMYIGHLSGFSHEREFLLRPGQTWKLHKQFLTPWQSDIGETDPRENTKITHWVLTPHSE